MEKQIFEIDGEQFEDLEGFFKEINRLTQSGDYIKNLNVFNDFLLDDMGTPFDQPFILIWKHSALSRERLGYEATLKSHENSFRVYSRGLDYDAFTRSMRRMNKVNQLKRFLHLLYFVEVNIEQAQESYRSYERNIALARQQQGETIFDWIMDCFRDVPEIEVRLE